MVRCQQVNGEPLLCASCKAGAYGSACELDCASPAHCDGTATCAQATGDERVCPACQEGWYGPDCAADCDSADTRCTDVTRCAQSGGAPSTCAACDPGAWGPVCASDCTPLAHCAGVTTCDQASGAGPPLNGYASTEATSPIQRARCHSSHFGADKVPFRQKRPPHDQYAAAVDGCVGIAVRG